MFEQPILSPRQQLVQDAITLMGLAPYVLPPSLDFSLWLKDTLTFGFRQSIPDYGGEILDHFEIEIVEPFQLKKSRNDQSGPGRSDEQPSRELSQSQTKGEPVKESCLMRQTIVTRNQRQQAYFSSLAEKASNEQVEGKSASLPSDATPERSLSTTMSSTKTALDKEKASFLFQKSLNLTVPGQTQNPYLKNSARGTYVGSHLSSKLSNITSLFREVKVPLRPKRVEREAEKPKRSTGAPANVVSNKAQEKTLTSSKSSRKAKTALLPYSPPRKRQKLSSSSTTLNWTTSRVPLFNIDNIESPPRKIIGETPSKPSRRRGDSPFLHKPLDRFPHLPPRSRPSLTVRYDRDEEDASDNISHTYPLDRVPCFSLSPMPQQKDVSSVVAQAAMAARKRR